MIKRCPLLISLLSLLTVFWVVPASAELRLGHLDEGAHGAVSAETAIAFAEKLEGHLGEPVQIRSLPDTQALSDWMNRFDMLDLAVVRTDAVAGQNGRFLHLGLLDEDGRVCVVARRGITGTLPSEVSKLLASLSSASPSNGRLYLVEGSESTVPKPVIERAASSPKVPTVDVPPPSPPATLPRTVGMDKLTVGIVPSVVWPFARQDDVDQLAGHLQQRLQATVVIRTFEQTDTLFKWFKQFRMIDAFILPREFDLSAMNGTGLPVAELLLVDQVDSSSYVMLVHRDLPPSVIEATRSSIFELQASQEGRNLLARLSVRDVVPPTVSRRSSGDRVSPPEPVVVQADLKEAPEIPGEPVAFESPIRVVAPVIEAPPQEPALSHLSPSELSLALPNIAGPPSPNFPDDAPGALSLPVLGEPGGPILPPGARPSGPALPDLPAVAAVSDPAEIPPGPAKQPGLTEMMVAPDALVPAESPVVPETEVSAQVDPVAESAPVLADDVAEPLRPEPPVVQNPEEFVLPEPPVVERPVGGPVLADMPIVTDLSGPSRPTSPPLAPEVGWPAPLEQLPQPDQAPSVVTVPPPAFPDVPVATAPAAVPPVPEESLLPSDELIAKPAPPESPQPTEVSGQEVVVGGSQTFIAEESEIVEEEIVAEEIVSAQDVPVVEEAPLLLLDGADLVPEIIAQPDIPQGLRPPGIPVVRPGRVPAKRPSLGDSLLLTNLPEPLPRTPEPSPLLPPANPEPGIVYVVPFVAVMVPPAVEERVFDSFIDQLNLRGSDLDLEFVILKEGLDRVDPNWLRVRKYVTGEIYGYVEDSGCCTTDMRARARLVYYQANQKTPAFAYEYPVQNFFDHDQSNIHVERDIVSDEIAVTLVEELFKTLQP